jgi:flagellar hook-associated protein 2
MATITSAGVGSGLDLEAIINVSLEAEDAPKQARFEKKESSLNIQLTALGQIKSDLSTFESTIETLKDLSNFNKRTTSVTQPEGGDVISVSSNSNATPGSFDIAVKQVAQGSRAVQSDASAYTSTDDIVTISGGILTFTAGSETFDVELAAGATLADLRNAINESETNFGVSANIINTGSMSKLVLTSNVTGQGNDLVVTNNTGELDGVSTVANAGGVGGLAIDPLNDSARDAIIEIDGIEVNSTSNTFENAIQDTTITVLKESPLDNSDPTKYQTANLSINTDTEFVEETLKKFVSSFNALMSTLDTVIESKTADSTARGIKNAIVNQIGAFATGAGPLQSIYDAGIDFEKDGTLSIRSTGVNTLSEVLSENYDNVGALFAGDGGIAGGLFDTVDLYLKSGGIIADQQQALELDKRSLETEIEKHEYRMELYEKQLREKYASLDVLVAGLRSQGSAITASLSNLPGFTKSE